MWIRSDGAFPAIVERYQFEAAQVIIRARSFRMSDDEMLEALRSLRMQTGLLSGLIIDEADGLPSSSAYRARFGGLLRAYKLVGYTPKTDYRYIEINRKLRQLHGDVVSDVIARLQAIGCRLKTDVETDLLSINDEVTVSVVIARCLRTRYGSHRWHLRFDTGLQPDLTIAVRMDNANTGPLDYYLLPRIDIAVTKLKLAEENGLALDAYRFDTLDTFFEFIEPVHVVEAA
jgi:hypothetical protein